MYNIITNEEYDTEYIALITYVSSIEDDLKNSNYAYMITSMKSDNNVDDLVDKYNRILEKILELYYDNEKIPDNWVDLWNKNKPSMWEDLKAYLNEQIKRVFDESAYSDKIALECISNLRESNNYAIIRQYIASKSSKEVNDSLADICRYKRTLQESSKYIFTDSKSVYYREFKPRYTEQLELLRDIGYYKGYEDLFFQRKRLKKYVVLNKTQKVLRTLAIATVIAIVIAVVGYNIIKFIIFIDDMEFCLYFFLALSVYLLKFLIIICNKFIQANDL